MYDTMDDLTVWNLDFRAEDLMQELAKVNEIGTPLGSKYPVEVESRATQCIGQRHLWAWRYSRAQGLRQALLYH
jgi:hypothetical protein